MFFGKASRECIKCKRIKLYKEFNKSKRIDTLCLMCAAWADYEYLSTLVDVEEAIYDNELEYQEALERQDFINDMMKLMED